MKKRKIERKNTTKMNFKTRKSLKNILNTRCYNQNKIIKNDNMFYKVYVAKLFTINLQLIYKLSL